MRLYWIAISASACAARTCMKDGVIGGVKIFEERHSGLPFFVVDCAVGLEILKISKIMLPYS